MQFVITSSVLKTHRAEVNRYFPNWNFAKTAVGRTFYLNKKSATYWDLNPISLVYVEKLSIRIQCFAPIVADTKQASAVLNMIRKRKILSTIDFSYMCVEYRDCYLLYTYYKYYINNGRRHCLMYKT